MQRSTIKRSLSISLLLSVLFHLLVLLLFSTIIYFYPEEKKKPPNLQQMRSYVYTGKITPSPPQNNVQSVQQKEAREMQKSAPSAQKPANEESLPTMEKPEAFSYKAPKSMPSASPLKEAMNLRSILASSRKVLEQNQRESLRSFTESEPIYLIGDENEIADPLIKMIGRALSANFEYPKQAAELGITGRVIVGFMLHPEGNFTDVIILSSSHNHDLDSAALYAVNKAPPVVGADRFLPEPKHFVVGFIFRAGVPTDYDYDYD